MAETVEMPRRADAEDEPGYDALVIAAHPDDAETQMGGTIAVLTAAGQRVLLVDLVDGEPTSFAERGMQAGAMGHGVALVRCRSLNTLEGYNIFRLLAETERSNVWRSPSTTSSTFETD